MIQSELCVYNFLILPANKIPPYVMQVKDIGNLVSPFDTILALHSTARRRHHI